MSEFQPPRPNYPEVYTSGAATAPDQSVAEQEERNRQHLAEVIQAATEQGKEPFDFAKFVEIYWQKDAQSNGLTGQESSSVVEDFMRRYYLDYPNVMTMADFARTLELGDMQIDAQADLKFL